HGRRDDRRRLRAPPCRDRGHARRRAARVRPARGGRVPAPPLHAHARALPRLHARVQQGGRAPRHRGVRGGGAPHRRRHGRSARPRVPPDVLEIARASPPPPRARSRIRSAFRVLSGLALITSITGVIAWGARHYVKTTLRFGVTDIVVTGARHRTAEEVIACAG